MLGDFAKPPGTTEEVVPDRGSDGQGSREEVGPVDVGGDEVVGPGEISFTFGSRKFALMHIC